MARARAGANSLLSGRCIHGAISLKEKHEVRKTMGPSSGNMRLETLLRATEALEISAAANSLGSLLATIISPIGL